jgi:flagellar basal-body rod protein FlgB
MDFAAIPLMNVMKAKLNFLSERQGALAQNVASADIPNYQAKDVAEPDFKKMAFSGGDGGQQLQVTTTNAKHIPALPMAAGGSNIINRASTFERNPSGNNVSIEEEMAKIADNQAEYQKVLNLYSKTIKMFNTAIGKPTG